MRFPAGEYHEERLRRRFWSRSRRYFRVSAFRQIHECIFDGFRPHGVRRRVLVRKAGNAGQKTETCILRPEKSLVRQKKVYILLKNGCFWQISVY